MQEVAVSSLPERYSQINADASSDVDVFHFIALASTKVIDYVEVLKASTDVVTKIDAVSRVAACCSLVGGMSLQGSHSHQTQAVQRSSFESSCSLGRCTLKGYPKKGKGRYLHYSRT